MTREELIKSISKRECHIPEVVHDLIRRAISEDEKVEGRYLKALTVEIKEKKISTKQYDYYVVTESKFVRIHASELELWFKLCPLDKFMGLEEKTLPDLSVFGVEDIDLFIDAGFPGEMQVKIHFGVSDEDLHQITFTSKEPVEKKRIKEFVSCVATAVSNGWEENE